jgi:hypothetical protein
MAKRPKKKKKGARRPVTKKRPNPRKKKGAKKRSTVSRGARAVLRRLTNPRKAKTGRWYKGPRGTKVRVRRSRGKFIVDVK